MPKQEVLSSCSTTRVSPTNDVSAGADTATGAGVRAGGDTTTGAGVVDTDFSLVLHEAKNEELIMPSRSKRYIILGG